MQWEADAFDKIAGLLDYPMFVVTTRVGDRRAGCLVGFTSQGATHLAVHLLSREHRELA